MARRASAGPLGLAEPSRVLVVSFFSCLLLYSALLSGCAPSSNSASGCSQEIPSLEPPRAVPGETFRLSGRGFGGGCDDSNLPFRPDPPQRGILIEMRQRGKAWDLATVDAGGPPNYAIDVELKVPKDAKPGGATVVIPVPNSAEPLRVPFEVLGDVPG